MDSKYAESVKNLCNVAYGHAGVKVDIIEPHFVKEIGGR